jgi:predicted ABC-type ATPase
MGIQKKIYMIGGPNGAGKTTVAFSLLPTKLECYEYVNADEIASGISPFNPQDVAVSAGKIMLLRLQELRLKNVDFAFETTMASKTFVKFLLDCKAEGYAINVLFVWLCTPELAIARVASRVRAGGHSIPEEAIRRRYAKGLLNFFNLFSPIADNWLFVDNSESQPIIVAEKQAGSEFYVHQSTTWDIVQGVYKCL